MTHLIASDEQRLDVGTIVNLYTIDARDIGGALMRFAPGTRDLAPIRYQNETYLLLPIEVRGLKFDVAGPAARPTLRVSALDVPTVALLTGTDNLRGARVRLIRTLERYLDGTPEADPNRHWPAEIFRIEGLNQRRKTEISWTLASPLDFDKKKLPGRQILRDVCAWQYRRWTGTRWDYSNVLCPYTGSAYFDTHDRPVAGANKDQCSRRLSGCRARFPGQILPYGGFVGVASNRTRRALRG